MMVPRERKNETVIVIPPPCPLFAAGVCRNFSFPHRRKRTTARVPKGHMAAIMAHAYCRERFSHGYPTIRFRSHGSGAPLVILIVFQVFTFDRNAPLCPFSYRSSTSDVISRMYVRFSFCAVHIQGTLRLPDFFGLTDYAGSLSPVRMQSCSMNVMPRSRRISEW